MASAPVITPVVHQSRRRAWVPFPAECYGLAAEPGTVLLETSRFDEENCRSYVFQSPRAVLRIEHPRQVPWLFERLEQALADGYHVAGYLGYECGYHFEPAAAPLEQPGSELPLAWLGVYGAPFVFDHRVGSFAGPAPPASPYLAGAGFEIRDSRLDISQPTYCAAIERIREYIAAGDVYQLNFTTDMRFGFAGSFLRLYSQLRAAQTVKWAAVLNLGNAQVLSLSPEMFLRRNGQAIVTRPMKGTAPRGRFPEEDRAVARWLHDDPKNRSENVMIVDLLRSDLGRIARIGSVEVRELFALEPYETLWQMTSTIAAALAPGTSYYDIFRALFPCGSVTGAPKVRAMQLIHQLERRSRGIYTGAIGYFSPAGEAVLNVAIRTLVLHGAQGRMGVGSGIVWDSVPQQEYEECRLKCEFLNRRDEGFSLIESLRWDRGYPLLDSHLERLEQSAGYFGFPFDAEEVRGELESYGRGLDAGTAYKVRARFDPSGDLHIESAPLEPWAGRGRVLLSQRATSSHDRFLFHKTTRRELYESELTRAQQQGFDDVIFVNERNEVTEGSISNVFADIGGRLCTPPVDCGLLPGVYRRYLLNTEPRAEERVLRPEDLRRADALYICNAVRGLRKVLLITE